MIPDAAPLPRVRLARRALLSTLALATIAAGSACATAADEDATTEVETDAGPGAGDVEATAAYLQQAAQQSSAEGYRLEMRFSLDGPVDEDAAPLLSGGVDDDRYHLVMDLGPMMEQLSSEIGGEGMPPGFTDLDMTIEAGGDRQSAYIRAPMFAALAGMVPPGDLGPVQDLAALGDGWGRVDVAALGDDVPTEIASAFGGQGADPDAIIDMIEAADNVEDLGSGEVRGTPVHGLSAEVSIAEMVEASGQDPETFADLGGVGQVQEEAVSALYETVVPIEVWIDADGYLRRMSYGYSMDDVAAALDLEAGDLAATGVGGLEFNYVVDMFDYGATVDFEAPADAVDITDAYAALLQA